MSGKSSEAKAESVGRHDRCRENVLNCLIANDFQTDQDLRKAGGGDQATRRLRELRTEKHGGYNIPAEYEDGRWGYRLYGQ